MDLLLYIFLSIVYLMVVHFAVGISEDFNNWIQILIFVFGAVIGWYMDSYITGYVIAVVLHLILF